MTDPNKVWPTGLTEAESEELHRNIIQGTQIFGMIAALAHLLANGTLGATLLFASFLAWAVADRISLKRRAPGPAMGKPGRYNDAIAIVAGLGLYGAFIGGVHLWLIGVSPR
jgi:uncharacterized membrane protein